MTLHWYIISLCRAKTWNPPPPHTHTRPRAPARFLFMVPHTGTGVDPRRPDGTPSLAIGDGRIRGHAPPPGIFWFQRVHSLHSGGIWRQFTALQLLKIWGIIWESCWLKAQVAIGNWHFQLQYQALRTLHSIPFIYRTPGCDLISLDSCSCSFRAIILIDFDPDYGNTHGNTCSYLSDLFCPLSNPADTRSLEGIQHWVGPPVWLSGIYFFQTCDDR